VDTDISHTYKSYVAAFMMEMGTYEKLIRFKVITWLIICYNSNMSIKLKSLRQSRESSDGFRILITRFRPRYIKKENESWDE